ncbi:lamin tail domain-containing protein [Verrucomicrobiaceae bacterium 227]
MKHLLLYSSLALPLVAQLRITEVMPSSDHSTGSANGDWFEITNTGTSAVNISGYSFDDSGPGPKKSGQIFPSYSIPAGASVIVLRESSSAEFRSLWNLPASIKIFTEADVPNFPGLGSDGDSVFLFNSSSSVIDNFTFGAATTGSSFARFTNGNPVPGGLSVDGLFGSYLSNDSSEDVGSPGSAAQPPTPLPPIFISPFSSYWITGRNLSESEFRVSALDPNPGDIVTLTATSKPAWMTFTDLGSGLARLGGTPTASEIGTHEIVVQAADNSGTTTPSTQTYQVTIAPDTSPIILNEYNGVDSDNFLGGGEETDPGAPTDPTLGRIAGNGGAWIEFVVTGNGGSPTVDLRNWTIQIAGNDKQGTIKLSNHVSLSAIPTGTILTFTEDRSVADTALPRFSDFTGRGYSWSNIWMHDAVLIDQSASILPTGRVIGSGDTRVTLRNEADQIVYGPVGESILAKDNNSNGLPDELLAVNSSEVLKLEGDPTSAVSPISVAYDDGDTSTFGMPNVWNSNLSTQSFAPFNTSNTPPVFATIPSRVSVRGTYSVSVSATDPGAKALTFSSLALPTFLTLTSTANSITITNNRPLTSADAGKYEITIQADNGGAANNLAYLVYQLDVQDPTPSVVLNEYNAVESTNFLNGGTAGTDSDGGPASSDSHFGRIAGNGGDWFELVVVGNGSAGTTNLTGWTIEIGKSNSLDAFKPITTVTLSDPAVWNSVGNGTLLTFIENNSAAGGLDTEVNRVNELSTTGYAWSNFHLGTASFITVDNLAGFEIDSDNTQFVIKNASGRIVFGPAGEGVAPLSGISGSEILELENDPSPLVATTDISSDTTPGYDDGSSGSTFGSANLFDPPGGTSEDRPQDFTPFIAASSPFQDYLASLGLAGSNEGSDSDKDGYSNLDEYLFGGHPNNSAITPTTAFVIGTGDLTLSGPVRISDPAYAVVAERSDDLKTWESDGLTIEDSASDLGPDFVERTATFTGMPERIFLRFATSTEE